MYGYACACVQLLDVLFGFTDGAAVKKRFPPTNTSDCRPAAAEIETQCLFRCTTRNATLSVAGSKGRTQPMYNYVFDHVASFNSKFWGPELSFCWDKVCHGADLPFVFSPNASSFGINFQPEERELALSMQTFWSNFAKTGSPGADGA